MNWMQWARGARNLFLVGAFLPVGTLQAAVYEPPHRMLVGERLVLFTKAWSRPDVEPEGMVDVLPLSERYVVLVARQPGECRVTWLNGLEQRIRRVFVETEPDGLVSDSWTSNRGAIAAPQAMLQSSFLGSVNVSKLAIEKAIVDVPSLPVLSGLFVSGGRHVAVLDGSPLSVGEERRGFRVVDISQERVVLEFGDRRFELNLGDDASKGVTHGIPRSGL